MIEFEDTTKMPPGPAADYSAMLDQPIEQVIMYNLEHPKYDTEEEFAHISEIWRRRVERWVRKHNTALLKPKRRPGRMAKPSQKQPKIVVAKQPKFPFHMRLGLTVEMIAQLDAVRGELSVEECTRQLLAHVLEPVKK
jgi:hypothetical protein